MNQIHSFVLEISFHVKASGPEQGIFLPKWPYFVAYYTKKKD